MNKKDRNRPKGLAIRLLSRITKNHAVSFPRAEELIIKCVKRYSSNWHGTRKHIYGDAFSCAWMIESFERRNRSQVALYKGQIVVRVKFQNQWRTLQEFYRYIEIEAMNSAEWQCKNNKILLRRLNEERLRWQRLQRQAN